MRRRYPTLRPDSPTRAGKIQVIDEYSTLLGKFEFEAVGEMAEAVVKRYTREQIDSVYLLFNEFKSVISQRVIVQRLLPVQEIGRREVTAAEEPTQAEARAHGRSRSQCRHQPERAGADRAR